MDLAELLTLLEAELAEDPKKEEFLRPIIERVQAHLDVHETWIPEHLKNLEVFQLLKEKHKRG